jgi:hypothetical protein
MLTKIKSNWNSHTLPMGMQNCIDILENSWKFLIKLKHKTRNDKIAKWYRNHIAKKNKN